MINLRSLMNDAKCYETVRQLRWPEGRCTAYERYFDDLTGTPLRRSNSSDNYNPFRRVDILSSLRASLIGRQKYQLFLSTRVLRLKPSIFSCNTPDRQRAIARDAESTPKQNAPTHSLGSINGRTNPHFVVETARD